MLKTYYRDNVKSSLWLNYALVHSATQRRWAFEVIGGVFMLVTLLKELRGSEVIVYAKIFFTTFPWTSVSRKSRPWYLKVSRVWSIPKQ